jgi:serine/threonine-protein kinase
MHDKPRPTATDAVGELTEHQEQLLANVLAEMTDRALRGEAVDIEEACRHHPDLAKELRELWGTVMVANAAGTDASHSNGDPDLNEFDDTFQLPRRFGDYQLLDEIGRGGMGIVFRARQISLNRDVAVKMILRGPLASPSERDRFRAEAESAARLDHPGIVPVYEVGEVDGRPYFSMKYIEGETLSDRLLRGPMPARYAARLLAEVSRAIQYAHTCGVLHRDLKPSNVIIDQDGHTHLTDFGLAKRITDANALTRTGAVLGTPAYMSPEQAAGTAGMVGPASDVYGLGCILYHMLTGRPPFEAASPLDAVMKVIEQDPIPPRQIHPAADRDLEMVAVRCLQKPPDLRYESAEALADDLEAFLKNEPLAVRSGRFAHVIVRWFRETHHATVLENWGVLWMWHSLALFVACLLTNILYWRGEDNRWVYFYLWTAGFGTWAAVFWAVRRRMGPVTFVERQIAHVWAASMACIIALFPLESYLGLEPLKLSPVLGLIAGMVFMVKAGILSGAFYVQAGALFLTAWLMAIFPNFAHLIFGTVSAACFFFPGLKYYRQRSGKEEGGRDWNR